eukprot:TRINITY_DN2880_c0_g2_i3.p1 TRINITY_DN2880_c0_g2~~TRINITY_DN2880_c0_g2_i3.p1  ORF type:complete len:207 (+),score=18.28 TRINITY_DN2880_c0_g2_i3:459-1079(+)
MEEIKEEGAILLGAKYQVFPRGNHCLGYWKSEGQVGSFCLTLKGVSYDLPPYFYPSKFQNYAQPIHWKGEIVEYYKTLCPFTLTLENVQECKFEDCNARYIKQFEPLKGYSVECFVEFTQSHAQWTGFILRLPVDEYLERGAVSPYKEALDKDCRPYVVHLFHNNGADYLELTIRGNSLFGFRSTQCALALHHEVTFPVRISELYK